jgi:GntR family transcriptional repressor for pyruvate dehydrogenase complex
MNSSNSPGDGAVPELVTRSRSRLGRAVKISERVASAIVEEIITDGLGPGDRLPNEAVMLERFEVGRGSLREALRILETHGLISLRSGPKGGPVVIAVDPRDVGRTFSLYLSLIGATMGELIDTRLFIEPMVARLAADNIDDEGRQRLEKALAREAAIPPDDPSYIEAANDFHYLLASMTGNRVFDLVATALKELYTTRLVGSGLASETTEPRIRLEHQAIGEAILAGDGDRAEKLMREHIALYLGRVKGLAPNFSKSSITWG